MLPRLALNHLALLDALVRTGGVGAAAAELGLTQSAASHRLREAERRAGAPLVLRGPAGVSLTADGARLAAFAERFLAELSRIEREIEEGHGGQVVRLGQATYNRYHWLPVFLAHLEDVAPDITLDLSGEATQRPLASLIEGRTDVSTVYGRVGTSRRLDWTRLGTDPLVAVMAPGHRLADEPFVTSEMLTEERVFLYPFAAEPGFEWEALIGAPTAPYRKLTTMPTPEAVIDLVRAGYGVSFFSRWAIEPEIASGALAQRPLGPEGMALDWWAVTRAADPPGSPARRVVAAFQSYAPARDTGLGRLGFPDGPHEASR
jgi:LysR family transcriptional regulator for metE and metH